MADGEKKETRKLIELGIKVPKLRIAWGLSRGSYLGEVFFDEECNDHQRGKLEATMMVVSEHGSFANKKAYKYPMPHTKGLGEFKTFQKRLYFFREGDLLVITHGATKKKDETEPNDLDRANRIMAELQGVK